MPQAYFPPLDKCLSGEERLMSWKSVHQTLCDPIRAVEETALEVFLTDDESIAFIVSSLEPLSPPSSKSKGDFETKTAPINVSQSESSEYDLEELKKDSRWLSDKLKIEELVALRVAVLEWQTRAEDLLRKAPMISLASTNGAGVKPKDADAERTRRDRQLAIFLEEQTYVLQTNVGLIEHLALEDTESNIGRTWLDKLAARITQAQYSQQKVTLHDTFCTRCVDVIRSWIEKLDHASSWPEPFQTDGNQTNQVTGQLFAVATAQNIVSVLRILLANTYALESLPSPNLVSSWYNFMAQVGFFQNLATSFPMAKTIQSLVSIISLCILRLPQTLGIIEDLSQTIQGVQYPSLSDESYIQDDTCLKEVNLVLYQAAQHNIIVAAPAIYAWSIITGLIHKACLQHDLREPLQIEEGFQDLESRGRRASRRYSTDDPSMFDKLYASLQNMDLEAEARDDPPTFFGRIALDQMDVYSMISQLCTTIVEIFGSSWDQKVSLSTRLALLNLVRESISLVGYGDLPLGSILTILRPDVDGRSTFFDSELAIRVITDDSIFVPAVLDQALSRYPYELTPLLRVFTTLASALDIRASEDLPEIVKILDSLSNMTVMVPDNFRSYVLDHEDENVSSMKLTEPLPLFLSKTILSLYGAKSAARGARTGQLQGTDQKNLLSIPSSTSGVFLRETRPYVFRLEHEHSGLGYLGLLLSALLPNADVLIPPMDTNLDRTVAAEIISLVTALLTTCVNEAQGTEGAKYVLDRFSLSIDDERDIVSVIADIMEVELLAHLEQSIQAGSMDLLVACADFFDKLILVAPERVWSSLASSSLLGLNGEATALAAVVSGSEVSTGRFRFLAACVSMYSHLITDAITGLVKRKSKPTKPSNRFDSPISFTDVTPERTMSTVLNAYQTVMTDVWQSLPDWRFTVGVELSEITAITLKAFSKLLRSAHGIGSDLGGITSLLIPASNNLLEACAPPKENGRTMRPFSVVLQASLAVDNEHLSSIERRALMDQGISALEFLAVLIRTSKTIDEPGDRASRVASQLLGSMPILASLLVADHSFKAPVYALLNEVVHAAQGSASEPPSLLGKLDAATAKSFLSVISHLDRPLYEIETEATIWNMLSGVMNSRQQWFALFILTGSLPKDRMKDDKTKEHPPKTKSLLAYALEQLSHITTLAPERAIAMLRFVSKSQNTWVWATHEVRSHPDFLKSAVYWLNGLRVPNRAANIAEELLSANEHEMAASLCNILAVNLHASIEVGDKTLIKLLPSKLAFLTQHGVTVSAYKRSLHLNLKDNFATRFPSCELADFRRTSANPAPFGRRYYYDLDLADEVLGHETAWHGSSNGRNQGFSDEFARANVNLSLVEAQTRLLKSWQVLSTTLSECAGQDETLQNELANVAAACLLANIEADLDQPGMDRIVEIRAEMAFIILSKLVSIKSSVITMKAILPAAWDLVRTCPTDYDVATSPDDIFYYRKLLQILYLAIQPYVYMESEVPNREPKATDETKLEYLDPAVAACIVQMMMKLIAPGFRALCGNLHDPLNFAEPEDFALITALLQAALSVPGVSAVHQQLSDVVSYTGIVRGALSLYSWSDRLAESMQQDPVYGEIAIVFLLCLSSVPLIAEQMALDGVLVQLSSANLSNYFRKTGGKGPFSEPRRMFVIWTEGFLALCLNLLDAVGPPIAAEVSAFLNSFPEQLQRAVTALENREPNRQNPYARAITLSLVSEAHNLCMIARILASDTARGAAEGIDAGDVPTLQYDYQKVIDDAEGLMRQKTSLASRIVPLGEREESWMAGGTNVQGDNVLLGKVVSEIKGLLECLGKEG